MCGPSARSQGMVAQPGFDELYVSGLGPESKSTYVGISYPPYEGENDRYPDTSGVV